MSGTFRPSFLWSFAKKATRLENFFVVGGNYLRADTGPVGRFFLEGFSWFFFLSGMGGSTFLRPTLARRVRIGVHPSMMPSAGTTS